MKLIVDAGGTSCSWGAINNGKLVGQITTEAIHALLTPDAEIIRISHKVAEKLGNIHIDEICFYGAGCANSEINNRLTGLLSDPFPEAKITIASDMLCAARALFGRDTGIACILGTGSNSCLYNGSEIIANTPPLGFILGDEGSGAVLGRTLISNILKNQMPEEITKLFFEKYRINKDSIIESVYRQPSPNKFLASFTPFLHENIEHPAINKLVTEEFKEFLTRNVLQYENSYSLPVSFIGSVAYHFAPQLRDAVDSLSLNMGRIEQSPLKGIIAYHL